MIISVQVGTQTVLMNYEEPNLVFDGKNWTQPYPGMQVLLVLDKYRPGVVREHERQFPVNDIQQPYSFKIYPELYGKILRIEVGSLAPTAVAQIVDPRSGICSCSLGTCESTQLDIQVKESL